MTKRDVFNLFYEWVSIIWGPRVIEQGLFVLSDEEPAKGVVASLAYAGNVMAIGNHLIKYPIERRFTLRISKRLLEAPPEHIEKIVIHEACHVGYPRHDRNFLALVREHGGTASESGLEEPGVRVERKVGSRYKVIATFETEHEARAWAREEMKRVPGRYQLLM